MINHYYGNYSFTENNNGDNISVQVNIGKNDRNLALQIAELVENYHKKESNKLTPEHFAVLERLADLKSHALIILKHDLKEISDSIPNILDELKQEGLVYSFYSLTPAGSFQFYSLLNEGYLLVKRQAELKIRSENV